MLRLLLDLLKLTFLNRLYKKRRGGAKINSICFFLVHGNSVHNISLVLFRPRRFRLHSKMGSNIRFSSSSSSSSPSFWFLFKNYYLGFALALALVFADVLLIHPH